MNDNLTISIRDKSGGIPVNTSRGGGLRLFWALKPAGWRFGFVASSGRTEVTEIDITNEALCMPSRECVAEGHSRHSLRLEG